MLSTVDMVVQQRDGHRRPRDHDDVDDDDDIINLCLEKTGTNESAERVTQTGVT